MAYTQENRLIRIATPLGGDALLISGFHGHEEISRLFRFELSLLSHNHSIAFKDIIGGNVTVSILLENGEERFFNGIIASFTQTGSNVQAERSGEFFSQYTAIMVPWLWLLTKTADLRIFQKKSAVDIIEQIFTEKKFHDFTKKLNGTYRPRTYCVQYRETDFNFISRLMEEEGISYYFSHENGKHTLVLADAINSYPPCPHHKKVRYQHMSGGGAFHHEDMIKTLELTNEIRVGKYSLSDYNFETPGTKLLVQVESKHNLGPGEKEVYDYPGLYAKRAEGDGLATVRIQEEEARTTSITGAGDVRGFASGYSFTLEDYFRHEMNHKKYLLTAVDHSAEQGFGSGGGATNSYANSFTCIPLDTPFHPLRLTPKPVVEGVQTAIVVGPAGEEIYTDEHGRVKVMFHWDRESKTPNENCSCWMRVGQIWAGTGWGAMYIPRVGQEVIVDFLEGDPDRPIVIGSVYHGTNKPPYTLPDEKTKTTIKSNSSKGGGGFNEIRFEDKKGSEQLFIHGEKDLDLRVKSDRKEFIGNERHLTVEKDQFSQVKKSKHQMVKEDYFEKVGGDINTTVVGDRVVKLEGKDHLTIGGDFMMKSGGATNIKSGGAHNQESANNFSIKSGLDIHQKAGMNIGVEAGMGIHIKAGMTVVIEAGVQLSLKVGGNFIDISPAGIMLNGSPMCMINSGGAAGSGGGCKPSPPAPPDPPDPPKEAKLPVDAKPGKVDKAPEGQQSKEKPDKLGSAKTKKPSHPQAQALAAASKDGTPLCDT